MITNRAKLKQQTQTRVIDAATTLFHELGFASTTIRDIAEKAGVSAGTVIGVGDKNALLVKVFDDLIAQVHTERGQISVASDNTADSCVARLERLVEPFISIFTTNLSLSRSYAAILVMGTHPSALFTELAGQLIGEFSTAITAGNCTDRKNAEAQSRALYSAYVGALFTWSASGFTDENQLRTSVHNVFTAICTCRE